jgi:DNA-binding response OmpR family regulator
LALRILYIEDHDDTRRTLSRLLRHFHYEVVIARDYRTARAILDQNQFDVLISDIALPDGDGCDLVMEAKSKQPLVSIAYTAYGTSREVERGFSSGFDHYFVKPMDFSRLRATLDAIAAEYG